MTEAAVNTDDDRAVRIAAVDLAIKSSTGYTALNHAIWTKVILESAARIEKFIQEGAQ